MKHYWELTPSVQTRIIKNNMRSLTLQIEKEFEKWEKEKNQKAL